MGEVGNLMNLLTLIPNGQCPMTPDASTERQSLQRGEPAQRAASETSARHWLPHALFPMPNAPFPTLFANGFGCHSFFIMQGIHAQCTKHPIP